MLDRSCKQPWAEKKTCVTEESHMREPDSLTMPRHISTIKSVGGPAFGQKQHSNPLLPGTAGLTIDWRVLAYSGNTEAREEVWLLWYEITASLSTMFCLSRRSNNRGL